MKNHVKYFLPFALILTLSSCTSYRYLKLDTPDISLKRENGFADIADSLQVTYQFYGNYGPLHLTISNRMNKSLQLDLGRSSLVVNDKAISLYSGAIEVNSINRGIVTVNTNIPQQVLFIPAHTYIDLVPIHLTDQFFDSIPDEKFVKEPYFNYDSVIQERIKIAKFNQVESPLVFKTYLTFSIPDSAQKEFVQEHHFYITEIVKAPIRPSEFRYMQSPNGDKFYVSRTRGTGVGLGLLVATAVIASSAQHGNGNH